MPLHDWTQVDAGTIHAFHGGWITHLSEALNRGRLPQGYYALPEQHFGLPIADILTLRQPGPAVEPPRETTTEAAVAVLAPPRAGRRIVITARPSYRAARRTIAIRHVSGHRVVSLIEIASPGNKDRLGTRQDLAEKIYAALRNGVHVLLVDILPPTRPLPNGVHGAVWECFDDEAEPNPPGKPLTLVSYLAAPLPEADLVHLSVADEMPEMPVHLSATWAVGAPLEPTYQAAFNGMPEFWRRVVIG